MAGKPRATIIIPVYRECELLSLLLERLTQDGYQEKEIIVVIDEPTRDSLELSEQHPNARFIFHEERVGKVNAMNEAAKLSHGDILIFLDGDVYIPRGVPFLEEVVREMEDTDILDIKKKICTRSFLSKMMYYEYVGFNIGSWLMARLKTGSPAINGAAFAIRRDIFESLRGFRRVVAEDLDMAMRAFVRGYRFKYTSKLMVYTPAPPNWEKWRAQRKRWALGAAMWLKEWYGELIWKALRSPQVFIPVMLFVAPSLVLLLLDLTDPNILFSNVLMASLILLMAKATSHVVLIAPAMPILYSFQGIFLADQQWAYAMRMIISTLVSFGCIALLFFSFSRKLGFEFRLHEFFGYYFAYSPVCLLFLIGYLLHVAFLPNKPDIDWKL